MIRWLRNFRKNRITSTKAVVQYERPWYVRWLILISIFILGILVASLFKVAIVENSLRSVVDPVLLKDLEECQVKMAEKVEFEDIINQSGFNTLTEELNTCKSENIQLKSDLAIYEKLRDTSAVRTPPGKADILHTELTQLSPGLYQYQILVAYSPRERGLGEGDRFEGMLFLSADMADNNKTLVIAGQNGIMSEAIDLKIRNFDKLTGTFELPPDRRIRLFRARIRQGSHVVATKEQPLPPSFYEITP